MEFNFFYRCSFDWNFSGLFASRDGAMGKRINRRVGCRFGD